MSAAEALMAARAAGIQIGIDGNDLVLEASAPPPTVVLDLLSRHKAAIVTLLRPADDGWSAEDWQVFFDERAGIAEFDGGLTRSQAEASAFARCATEWLNRNPVRAGAFNPFDDNEAGKLATSMGRLGDGRPASVIGAVVDLMAAANLRKRQETGEVTR